MRHRIQSLPFLLGSTFLALLLAAGVKAEDEVKPLGKSIILGIESTYRLQMTTKKTIATAVSRNPGVVGYRKIEGDPTTIMLVGQKAGIVVIELTDVDGKKEAFEVIVQIDVQYLKTQLERAVPSANVTPIPYGDKGIILTGNVARAEDVSVIVSITQAVGGLQVVNALRVGGVSQVQLDVVIAQVSRTDLRAMAFNFFTDSQNFFFGSNIGSAAAAPTSVGLGSSMLTVAGMLSGVPGTPNSQGTNILFGVLHNSYGFLGFLQALRNEGLSKDLSQPSLTTMSGTPAHLLVGGQQAIPQPGGLGTVSITYMDFGTDISFLPIVLGNGKIHLEGDITVSALSAANGTSIDGTVVPGLVKTATHATVELETGQTFVIAGLIQHDVQAATSKTPILGDLPFLGAFFSSKSYQDTEEEVVVLVTPHLVDGQDRHQLTTCLPGQESRSPDDFELFLEGILEAPRGPRQVFPGDHYVPAFKNSPTYNLFPCGGRSYGNDPGTGASCGANGCNAAAGQPAVVPPPAPRQLTPVSNSQLEPPTAPPLPPVTVSPDVFPETGDKE